LQNDHFKGCKQVEEINGNSRSILEDSRTAGIVTAYGFLRRHHPRRVGSHAVIGEGKKWMDQVDLLFFFMSVLAVRGTATYKTKKTHKQSLLFFSQIYLTFSLL
jgi:hypothetical protein